MAAIDIGELLDRVVAIEKEALAALSTPVASDAVPYLFHVQEAFPFWTNRLGTVTIDTDSQDFDVYTVEVVMRLSVGYRTEGLSGGVDAALNDYIPQVIQYTNERELLQSAAYPTGMVDLVQARVTACRGFTVFESAGTGQNIFGTEFTLTATLVNHIEQAYL